MFKNKAADGQRNICGKKIAAFRKRMRISQRALADKIQLTGVDMTKNAIQKIESGERFVIDIELNKIAEVFNVTADELMSN